MLFLIRDNTVGALPHEIRVFQYFIVLPQVGSFVGSPFGAIPHFRLQIQFSIVLSQGGSFVGGNYSLLTILFSANFYASILCFSWVREDTELQNGGI